MRSCAVCGGAPADVLVWPEVDERAGWWCDECDRRMRLRRMGPWRRLKRRTRYFLRG